MERYTEKKHIGSYKFWNEKIMKGKKKERK
jgi:hypothetical protein